MKDRGQLQCGRHPLRRLFLPTTDASLTAAPTPLTRIPAAPSPWPTGGGNVNILVRQTSTRRSSPSTLRSNSASAPGQYEQQLQRQYSDNGQISFHQRVWTTSAPRCTLGSRTAPTLTTPPYRSLTQDDHRPGVDLYVGLALTRSAPRTLGPGRQKRNGSTGKTSWRMVRQRPEERPLRRVCFVPLRFGVCAGSRVKAQVEARALQPNGCV